MNRVLLIIAMLSTFMAGVGCSAKPIDRDSTTANVPSPKPIPITAKSAIQSAAEFFDPGRSITSPSGRLVAISAFTTEASAPRLFVEDRHSGLVILKYPYTRGLGIVWAPHQDRLAINDHFASDLSNCLIYLFDAKTPTRIDIRAEMHRKLVDHSEIFSQ